jgi:hypothetical protein
MKQEGTLSSSLTNWESLENMRDEEIDFSDIPQLTEEQLSAMRPTEELIPALAKREPHQIVVPLDKEVVNFYRVRAEALDVDYELLINAVLRNHAARSVKGNVGLRSLIRTIVREEMSKVE